MEDPRFDYEAELKTVKSDIMDEITLERKQERFEALQRGMTELSRRLDEANPDCIVMVSNLHGDIPPHQQQIFSIFTGDELPSGGAQAPADQLPTEPGFARHLVEAMTEGGIDVCGCPDLGAASGIGDAFTFLYELYARPGTLPMVPVMISRYLPNQPSPRRAHQLGLALRQAIESWDSNKRVAVMASGGLSHQILDEPLDRSVVAALTTSDVETLCSIPRDRLNRGPGTPEILNWVAVSAAMADAPMTLVDYVPCYRSPAGTGHGVTFGYWT
jgi:aromatic ring-opening dioxygenase catalytic subunit (LigB family)